MQSQVRWHGYDPDQAILKVSPREVRACVAMCCCELCVCVHVQGELLWRTEDIVKAIEEHGDSLALVYFSGNT